MMKNYFGGPNIKGANLILLIFLLSFLLRLVVALRTPNSLLGGDADFYDYFATSVSQGKGILNQLGKPTAFYPPVYPLFLAFIYMVFGKSYLFYKIAQAFIGALTCITIYFIGKALLNQNIGLIAAIIASCYHFFIVSNTLMMSESIFTFFLVLAVFLWIQFHRREGIRYPTLLGLSLALASLTKVAFLYFIIVIFLAELLNAKQLDNLNYGFYKKIFICFLGFIFLMSLWTIRNYLVFHKFIYSSTQTGITLYSAYHPRDEKIFGLNANDATFKEAEKIESEVERSDFLIKKTIESIKKNPQKLYKYLPLKIMNFWNVFDWEILGQGRYNFSFAFILPFAFIGMYILRRCHPEFFFLVSPMLYFLLIAIVIEGLPRFRLPVEPFLIILASLAIYNLSQKYGQVKMITLLAGWLLINLTLFFNSPLVKEITKNTMYYLGLW